MGQEAPFSVKGGAVAMEPRGKEDHDISFFPFILYFRVGDLLECQRCDRLPDVEGLPYSPLRVLLPYFRCEVVYAARRKQKITGVTLINA